jgi:hypothetical protein
MEPTPNSRGITTSEGITAIASVGTPLIAALAKLDGWQLVASLGIAAVVAIAYLFARTWLKRGAVALTLLLLPSLAHASDPAPTHGPVNVPVIIETPEHQAIPAADLAPKLTIVRNQIDLLAAQLGVPVPKVLPASFWDSTGGKVLMWTFFGAGMVVAGVQAGLPIYEAVRN